jgi:hypothetical protein
VRKAELEQEAARKQRELEEADVPAGMMLLPEEERLSTLRQLAVTKAAVEKDLCRLPFVVETPSQIRHKTNLENRLTEVEEAIKVFSRKKVYVRKDDDEEEH